MNVFRHNPLTRLLLYGVTVALYLFVFAPIVIVIYGSFDPNEVLSFPYRGASLRWYREFFESRILLTAIRNSVALAFSGSDPLFNNHPFQIRHVGGSTEEAIGFFVVSNGDPTIYCLSGVGGNTVCACSGSNCPQ